MAGAQEPLVWFFDFMSVLVFNQEDIYIGIAKNNITQQIWRLHKKPQVVS